MDDMTTDFEQRAIEIMVQAGISRAHIQLQKKNVFQAASVENYYDKVEDSEKLCENIPVEKILAIKTTWPIEGKSVYDLFMGRVNEEIDAEKINQSLKSLEENGLAFQQAFYSGEFDPPINFNYYKADDCYILQQEGLHRTIAAKMFNAPEMSGLVTSYELNEEKKKQYDDYISLKEILRLTDIKGLTLDLFQDKKDK
ncbi:MULTISPECIES: hypothetical protein [Enterococcus]|nr:MULTISPECIES: hypothetical protein [Enterococcus]